MGKKWIIWVLIAFALGILIGQLRVGGRERETGIVYIKEFVTVDANSGEKLNCSIQTPNMPEGKTAPLLLEMPPGGPYRATTSLKTAATLIVTVEGYSPVEVNLAPFKGAHAIAGRISTETIAMKKTPTNSPRYRH